jgi:hypothetical protein
LSQSHGCQLTDEKNLSTWCAVHQPPPSTCPNSLDYGLPVRTIMASKGISLNSLDHGLHGYLETRSITASKCISTLAGLRPRSVFSNSRDNGLETCSIPASKCILKFARLRSPSVSSASLEPGLQVHPQTHSIMASEHISEFTRSSFSGSPRNSLKHCLQPQSRYTVCIWVGI